MKKVKTLEFEGIHQVLMVQKIFIKKMRYFLLMGTAVGLSIWATTLLFMAYIVPGIAIMVDERGGDGLLTLLVCSVLVVVPAYFLVKQSNGVFNRKILMLKKNIEVLFELMEVMSASEEARNKKIEIDLIELE